MDTEIKKTIQIEINVTRESLIQAMTSLGNNLLQTAKLLSRIPEYPISSLGEIQGIGSIIDAKCAKFATLISLLRKIESLEKAK